MLFGFRPLRRLRLLNRRKSGAVAVMLIVTAGWLRQKAWRRCGAPLAHPVRKLRVLSEKSRPQFCLGEHHQGVGNLFLRDFAGTGGLLFDRGGRTRVRDAAGTGRISREPVGRKKR